ncbi:MAG: protein kinase [Chitinophagaceae bacterium]|nr:protein kinase [Chitinophagaceae bacterium]
MAIRALSDEFKKHYQIDRFFAPEKKGGQKMVYFVERDGNQQVMKLYPDGKDDRFDREMAIYEKFKDHDGIPKIFETDSYEGEGVVFEEFVPGSPLNDISGTYYQNSDKIKGLMKSIITILTPVWEQNLVHRDIKPENVMIRNDGQTVLLDFGIARDLGATSITSTGFQPGTYIWAAPEQLEGKKDMVSLRTDLFSLAVLGYYLYHGRMPFGESYADVKARYDSGNESCSIDCTCSLKPFFETALRFSPNYRPRKVSAYTTHL